MTYLFVVSLLFAFSSLVVATDWKYFERNAVKLSPSIPIIIGGEVAAAHSYPFVVGLLLNGNTFCGGSLVSENYVLTAAHCGVLFDTVDVILGAYNITVEEDTQIRITGEKVIVHENYNSTNYQNDIALIKLSEPATINEYIQLASLPSRSDIVNEYADDIVMAVGWGLVEDVESPTARDISPVLRFVNVSVITIAECAEYYNDYERQIYYITENNICTSGYKNRGTCNCDSGGPLLYNGVEIGIVSSGSDLCEICSPSIFTKVTQYLDWIEDNSDVVIS